MARAASWPTARVSAEVLECQAFPSARMWQAQQKANPGHEFAAGCPKRLALRSLPTSNRRGIVKAPMHVQRIAGEGGTVTAYGVTRRNHVVKLLADKLIHRLYIIANRIQPQLSEHVQGELVDLRSGDCQH